VGIFDDRLHLATGSNEITKLLIAKGADVNVQLYLV
jgi:hypothetical protein